jgi:dipeptidyl aminopeptidase/acylaminoacyl peptidase
MKKWIFQLILGVFMMFQHAFGKSGYLVPDESILQIYNARSFPVLALLPFSNTILQYEYQDKQSLSDLTEPTVKLAGVELSKRLFGEKEMYPITSMEIKDAQNNKTMKLVLPENIKIRNYQVSFDNRYLALTYETDTGIKLMTADLRNAQIKTYPDILINDAVGDKGYFWLNDGKSLLLKTIPRDWNKEPVQPLLPQSPVISETEGKYSQLRTYQNLLQNPYDEELFDYYFTVQLMKLDVRTGKRELIGEPGILTEIQSSPNHDFFLLCRIRKPYSYLVPYYFFPKQYEIWNKQGHLLKILHHRMLQDEIPIGGTYQGPRNYQWQPHFPATLVWVEALDDGNPKLNVPERDAIFFSAFPFTTKAELFRLQHRFSQIDWSEEKNELIAHEYDRDNVWRKSWLFHLGQDKKTLLFDLSARDDYNKLGTIITKTTVNGEKVFVKKGDDVFYLNNQGATPEGNRPFLTALNIATLQTKELFRSQSDKHERIFGFVSPDMEKLFIRSESIENPPNFFIVNLKNGNSQQITYFTNPYPKEAKLQKELITYSRNDGISLSGTLYLPYDYKSGTRLPLILHAYPREFTDAVTAGQINLSPNQFDQYFGTTVKYFAMRGYAVLANASFPIVGNPETVNETFIQQILENAKAAIDYLNEREIINPQKVGITGHSYGAFMVANVLAHSNLCAAGIANSGAYNRTLTPFGFQSERRTLWQANDFYIQVSPIMHADKIKQPILLIHGENDPNPGTFPMQSERFYQALQGNGATAKLIILPLEGHGYRSRESQLHVITEMFDWFDKHVKNRVD